MPQPGIEPMTLAVEAQSLNQDLQGSPCVCYFENIKKQNQTERQQANKQTLRIVNY